MPYFHDLPNLSPEEWDLLAANLGGEQTNDFIKATVETLPKNTLPGGVFIPTPDYLEIEPFNIWEWKEKEYFDNPRNTTSFIPSRPWDEEVFKAKMLNPEMSSNRAFAPPFLSDLPLANLCRQKSRKSLLFKLAKECKASGNIFQPIL